MPFSVRNKYRISCIVPNRQQGQGGKDGDVDTDEYTKVVGLVRPISSPLSFSIVAIESVFDM